MTIGIDKIKEFDRILPFCNTGYFVVILCVLELTNEPVIIIVFCKAYTVRKIIFECSHVIWWYIIWLSYNLCHAHATCFAWLIQKTLIIILFSCYCKPFLPHLQRFFLTKFINMWQPVPVKIYRILVCLPILQTFALRLKVLNIFFLIIEIHKKDE